MKRAFIVKGPEIKNSELRTHKEIQKEVKSLIRDMRQAGFSLEYIRKNIYFKISEEEAEIVYDYLMGRRTVSSNSSPTTFSLSMFGLKLSYSDIEFKIF